MSLQGVTPENIIAVAKYLLAIDRQALAEEHQTEFDAWVFNLRELLLQYSEYNQPRSRLTSLGLSRMDLLEYQLQCLLESVKAFMGLLTPSAKQELKEWIRQRREQSSLTTPEKEETLP